METRIITIDTRRSDYSIKEAADDSITVDELIEELRNFPGDCKVVFKNDNGYTYGYIQGADIDSEYPEPEEEEEDLEMQRPEMEYELSEAVRKNGDKPVKIIAVASDDGERMYLSVGYNDSRVFGVATDDEDFVPIEDLSDDEVYSVYVSMTRW
jgi:hypothetical protein